MPLLAASPRRTSSRMNPDHDVATLAAIHRDIGTIGERLRITEHAIASIRKDVDQVIRADDIASAVAAELRTHRVDTTQKVQHRLSALATVSVAVAATASMATLALSILGVL